MAWFVSSLMQNDELVKIFLTDRDEPCAACGYNLRGVQEPRCPECGAAIRLIVDSESRQLRSAWNWAWWSLQFITLFAAIRLVYWLFNVWNSPGYFSGLVGKLSLVSPVLAPILMYVVLAVSLKRSQLKLDDGLLFLIRGAALITVAANVVGAAVILLE